MLPCIILAASTLACWLAPIVSAGLLPCWPDQLWTLSVVSVQQLHAVLLLRISSRAGGVG
jgi:hypothetical protein